MAGVGAGLILIALFLPMITGPFGVWMSFVDVPWKAVTAGFAIVDEKAERRSESDLPRGRPSHSEPPDPGKSAAAFIVVLVGIGSVVYPILVLAVLGFTGYQMASARSSRGYFAAGLLIGAATVAYAIGLLLLNVVPEMRLVMGLVSPGFGWAVLIVGTAALSAAGLIRLEK